VGLSIRVLGPVGVEIDGRPVSLGGTKPVVVLAGLLLRANQLVPVEELAGWLWDADEPADVRGAIQNYVFRVRRALAPHTVIHTERGGYRASVDDDAFDLARFRAGTASGKRALDGSDHQAAARFLAEALAEWRGAPLSNVDSSALLRELPRLEELRLQAVEWWADALLGLGELAAVIGELTRLTEAHPLREKPHEQLMRALAQAGRPAEALAVYRRLAVNLAEELGLDPGARIQQLHQRVLAADPELTSAPPSQVPRQLPAEVAGFTGREPELEALRELLAGGQSATRVAAIEGTAGVGKTSLAVRFAHEAAGAFPDGQLFLSLHGFGPADPVAPAVALENLLRALGVSGEQVPADPEARAALWRTHTAGRRLLVVLDDARDSEQVRPLLPGSGSLVLVTSRVQLRGLAAREGARPITLDPFDEAGALELLAGVVGADRVAAEPEAARELVESCGGLPLGIRVIAERARGLSLETVVKDLRSERDRLALFNLEDGAGTDLRAVFAHSYRALAPDAAQLFRLLGVCPGVDVTAPAVAALLGLPAAETRRLLDRLVAAHLLTASRAGRYAPHALMRDFAAELAAGDPEPVVRQAVRRVLDWYLHTAVAASGTLNPFRPVPGLPAAPDDVRPLEFPGYEQALAWYDAEYQNLLGGTRLAADRELLPQAWQLPAVLVQYFHVRGRFPDWVESCRRAIALCRSHGDVAGEASLACPLGYAYALHGRPEDAIDCYTRGLKLAGEDDELVAPLLAHLTMGYAETGQSTLAVHYGQLAGEAADRVGSPARRAVASRVQADAALAAGHPDAAFEHASAALELVRAQGYAELEANILRVVARIHRDRGAYADGLAAYRRALDLLRQLGMRFDVGMTLAELGDLLAARGDLEDARRCWERSLTRLREFGHPEAERLTALVPQPK
jgi:DNA-binding SARP family transcriptional activator